MIYVKKILVILLLLSQPLALQAGLIGWGIKHSIEIAVAKSLNNEAGALTGKLKEKVMGYAKNPKLRATAASKIRKVVGKKPYLKKKGAHLLFVLQGRFATFPNGHIKNSYPSNKVELGITTVEQYKQEALSLARSSNKKPMMFTMADNGNAIKLDPSTNHFVELDKQGSIVRLGKYNIATNK